MKVASVLGRKRVLRLGRKATFGSGLRIGPRVSRFGISMGLHSLATRHCSEFESNQSIHCTRSNMSLADYRMISDGIAADIAQGRMAPGSRMPTQRQFAYERGIAVSTASRVYAELTRRGLVTGEVGRGTFIRNSEPDAAGEREAEGGLVNLEHVFSILPHQAADLAASLKPASRSGSDSGHVPTRQAGRGRAGASQGGRFLRAGRVVGRSRNRPLHRDGTSGHRCGHGGAGSTRRPDRGGGHDLSRRQRPRAPPRHRARRPTDGCGGG